jgi:hypothetical protein
MALDLLLYRRENIWVDGLNVSVVVASQQSKGT